MRRLRLAPLLIVLLAVAFRLWGLNGIAHSYDRGYPHGLGLLIRDAIAAGRWSDLPVVGVLASINLSNPAGASYFWALFGTLDANPYTATVFVALLHAVVVCSAAQRISARLFGETAGLLAGLLAATSIWGGWVARGAWLQGTLEVFAALCAWLLFNGFARNKPRRVAAGFIVAAVAAQTYLTAFGLFAQVIASAGIGLLGIYGAQRLIDRSLKRALVIGTAALVLSLGLYAAAFAASRGDVRAAIDNPNAINTDLAPGAMNLDPVTHALRLASGRDYENTYGAVSELAARDTLSDVQATAIDLLIVAGVISTLVLARRSTPHRLVLAWFIVPILATGLIANIVMRDWKVHVFYLILASPMMHVLASAPLGWLQHRQPAVATAMALLIALPHSAIMAANLDADVANRARFPLDYRALDGIPLSTAARLSHELGQTCDQIINSDDPIWLASWIDGNRLMRKVSYAANVVSAIAQIDPAGQACHIGAAPSPLADRTRVIELGGINESDQSPARVVIGYLPQPNLAASAPLYTTNIGWSLLTLDSPASARPGETIVLRHVWRVDQLPSEPYANWYVAPFVNLIGPDSQRIAAIDQARALPGYAWRPGAQLLSHIRLTIPAAAPAGRYTLQFSLFDPNEKKNAVYFDPRDPALPIVVLERVIDVR
jgi:hypothetical protein